MPRRPEIEIPIKLLTGEKGNGTLAGSYRKVIKGLFSEAALPVFIHMARNEGKMPDDTDLGAIDHHFLRTLGQLHGFPSNASDDRIRDHWGRSLDAAYHLVNYATDTSLPVGFGYRDQDTELYMRSTSPRRILSSLAYHPRRRFQEESRRQFALAIVVGDFMAFNSSAGLRDRNEEINELLSKQLFANRGAQHERTIYTRFASATNEYVGSSSTPEPPDPFTDVKKVERILRVIEPYGDAHFDPRGGKDLSRSGLKALIESIEAGGNVQTLSKVTDQFGSKIALVDGSERDTGEVMERVIDIIKQAYPEVKIDRRDKVRQNRGQAALMEALAPMKRTLFYFPDLPPEASYEFIVRTWRSEMNGGYMNGIVDNRTGRRTGPGHMHYEHESIAKHLTSIMFPNSLYGSMNRELAFSVRSAEIAERLRDSENDPTVHFGVITDGGYFPQGHYIATERADGSPGGYYLIVDQRSSRFRLRRTDGTEFEVGQTSVIGHGLVGSERIIGSIKMLLNTAV